MTTETRKEERRSAGRARREAARKRVSQPPKTGPTRIASASASAKEKPDALRSPPSSNLVRTPPPSEGSSVVPKLMAAMAVIGVALGLVAMTNGTPQGQIPDTAAGQQLEWVLSALNGRAGVVTDAEMSERFAASALAEVSVDELREHLEYWEGRNPNYEFRETAGPDTRTELHSHVLTSSGDLGLIIVEVEDAAPHRIERLHIGEPEE